MSDEYDAADRTKFSLGEAEALVGTRARLPLTGTIVDAGESDAGAWVLFEIDARWGFRGRIDRLGCDVEALDLLGATQ